MKTLIFHDGELAKRFPKGLKVHGDSAAECIAALKMIPGFREEDGKLYQVTLPDFRSKDALYEKTDRTEIHVHTIAGGGGGKVGSFFMIAIGVVLIAFATPIAGALTGTLLGTVSAGSVATFGALLAVNGLVNLLMPQPDSATSASDVDEGKSNYLPADKNTVKAGTRIPLLYGRAKAYGHILSFQVSATNLGDPASVIPPAIPGALVATGNSDYQITIHDWT